MTIEDYKNAKPILFNTEMVRAIQDDRKTCTRRVIKFEFLSGFNPEWAGYRPVFEYGKYFLEGSNHEDATKHIKPRYKVGDILYVRETWQLVIVEESEPEDVYGYVYYASPETYEDYGVMINGEEKPLPWHPSIHMPKEAARIFLRVTAVRVERLQEILCGDMKKEGCIPNTVTGGQWQQWQNDYFAPLWNSTVKKADLFLHGWKANPWVEVYEFKRVVEE